MKTYKWVGGTTPFFLTSEMDGGECSASRHCRFTPREKRPQYPSYKRLSGPQGRYGRCGEEKSILLLQESNPDRPARTLSLYRLSYPDSHIHNINYKNEEHF
jgi:hypothetical protein